MGPRKNRPRRRFRTDILSLKKVLAHLERAKKKKDKWATRHILTAKVKIIDAIEEFEALQRYPL